MKGGDLMATIELKGVYCKQGKYWYARIGDRHEYCGMGTKGKNTAIAKRKKYDVECHENREIEIGLNVSRSEFKTVGDLVKWYLNLPSVKELKNLKRKQQIGGHIKSYFGKHPIGRVEGDVQEEYREHRISQGVMHGTIDTEIQNLSAMYHLALKRKKISPHAMPGEFVQRKEVNPRRTITDDEFESILKHSSDEFAGLLICGWESAMRLGEIINLTPAQIHLDELHISGQKLDYIYLGTFDTKTGAERIVPVSERLKGVLRQRMEGLDPEDLIFTRKGRKYADSPVATRMKTVCKRAGIPYGDKLLNKKGERVGIVFHCLRHTRISKWVDAGWSDEIIRRASGHRSLDAYRRYIKLDRHVVMRLVKPKRDKLVVKSPRSLAV
jgi:integrase